MHKAKETIYDFIRQQCLEGHREGVDTIFIAEHLGMQRPNVSAILSQLVEEGKISKTSTRPVIYSFIADMQNMQEESCFKNMIGYDDSLKNAIRLAKAAVLYPKKSLNIMIHGMAGSGKSLIANMIYLYAKEMKVISQDAPFIKVNCRHYVNNMDQLKTELLSGSDKNYRNIFDQSEGGILFIDHINLLDGKIIQMLIHFIETGEYATLDGVKRLPRDLHLVLSCNSEDNKQVIEDFSTKLPVNITLPSLSIRTLKERFELINYFFTIEATESRRQIVVDSELIICLLLYECTGNVKQLRNDIKIACANAFVRYYYEKNEQIRVFVSDFENYVRKGFLNYKKQREEIVKIIPEDYSYMFEKNSFVKLVSHKSHSSVYEYIDEKMDELSKRGIEQKDIHLIISSQLENEFKKYRNSLANQIVNMEHLSKLVNLELLRMIEDFMNDCSRIFNIVYPAAVFYGLCLHVNALPTRDFNSQRLSNQQIMDIIREHNEEYSFCLNFVSKLEDYFKIKLPIDEVVILTMFVIDTREEEPRKKAQVLIAMHGDGTASSVSTVIRTLVKVGNVHPFDLSLDIDTKEEYARLKKKILDIDQGKGIIAIYDMGSLKMMLETIMEETRIEIRTVCMPITAIALEAARKTAVDEDFDLVYHTLMCDINAFYTGNAVKEKVIITLCNTGDGGALQLKKYIDKNSSLKMNVIPLAIGNRQSLIKEVKKIQETYKIHCFIGISDPKLYGIPFITISDVLNNKSKQLDSLLRFSVKDETDIYFDEIYEYLEEQLEFVQIAKIKSNIPQVIEEINEIFGLNIDQKLGLFMHISCLINRILGNEQIKDNINTKKYQAKYKEEFSVLLQIFRKVEKVFKIIISDGEIATILEIIKQM